MDKQQDSSILPNGTVIADRYEITSFLAAGGMAQVYVATQKQINRPVALKVLAASFSMNQNVVMRFFREAHVVGALSHPNTVHIFDMGETPDHRLFIAMELLKGEELSERIKKGPMTFEEALPIVKQVAGSLSEAHQLGIIHRDLKPDNIFLTTLNVVKVLDFGIAKLKDDEEGNASEKRLTKAGTAPGTPEYMSPEQARGKDLDARSDIYSLGVVLYEMLCGHPPFEESTFLGTILMHVQSPPPPLPDNVPEIVRKFVIDRLLAKEPSGRPDSAEAFIKEIDEIARKLDRCSPEMLAEEEQLSKARAEIEALKSQLAQSQREKKAAEELPEIEATPSAPETAPSAAQNVNRQEQKPAAEETVRSGRNSMVQMPRGARSAMPPAPESMKPADPGNSGIQSAINVHRNAVQQSIAQSNNLSQQTAPMNPQMMQMMQQQQMQQQQMMQQARMQQMNPQMMQQPRMTQTGMPAMNPQMMQQQMMQQQMMQQQMMQQQMMQQQMMQQQMMQQNNRMTSSQSMPAAPRRNEISDTSTLSYRREQNEFRKDEEVELGGGRPRDSFSGIAATKRPSSSSQNKEMTFMMFAQPLCTKLGPSKSAEALQLAKSVWNAVLMGDEATDMLVQSAEGRANLTKLIELMISRKEKFFSEENWPIEDLEIKSDNNGRLDIRII